MFTCFMIRMSSSSDYDYQERNPCDLRRIYIIMSSSPERIVYFVSSYVPTNMNKWVDGWVVE